VSLEIRPAPLDGPLARALIAGLDAELLRRYPEEGATHFRLDPVEVSAGRGLFVVALAAEAAVGCGAMRRLDARDAELKRMYVVPAARGRGVGRALVAALESEARRLGARRLVLEAGARQPEALGLYRGCGFVEIPRFGEYVDSPLSLCMAKLLSPA
jgi:GNAT superfamily N-acetyltransferase